MTKQIQHVKSTEHSTEYEYTAEDAERQQVEDAKIQKVAKMGEIATGGVDELLEEIDSVLETNAAAFVRNYRQKGGE